MADAGSGPDITQLVAEYHRAVYAYAYRLTGSVQDAEDLTQQTFLAAMRKTEQLREADKARSWLFAILRNCFLRDRQRRRPMVAADWAVIMDPAPASQVADLADHDWLQQALEELPESQRIVVTMYYFEECAYREIADQLNIPIGTVMSRLARAKEHLRAALDKSIR